MVLLVNVIKYLLNSAMGGAQMLEQIQALKSSAGASGSLGAMAP